jgi:hypothetical protein
LLGELEAKETKPTSTRCRSFFIGEPDDLEEEDDDDEDAPP